MFSVYVLVDPRTKKIRYVGQTKQRLSRRLYQHVIKCSSPSQKQRHVNYWIAGLLAEGYKPQIRLVCKRNAKEEIDKVERVIISRLSGTAKLCNHTSGGDGSYTMSEETRRKMSESHKGTRNHFYGRKHSEETKRKISAKLTGRKLTVQQRRNISKGISGTKNPFYGRKHTEVSKRKMGDSKAKIYRFKNPKGQIVEITNLNRFCKENGLNQGAMWNVVNPPYRRKKYKGWTRP